MRGYKEDSLEITEIHYEKDSINASIKVTNYFMPSDGQYHFTAFHAQLFICQLMILHMSLCKGFKKKPGEAYMRNFEMRLNKPIHKTSDIQIKLRLSKTRDTLKGVFVRYDFDIEGAFIGKCSGLQIC